MHRQSQASLRRCQEETSRLEEEAHREAEEKALLREALERTRLQLDQEKRLQQVAKRHKVRREHPTPALCNSQLQLLGTTLRVVSQTIPRGCRFQAPSAQPQHPGSIP